MTLATTISIQGFIFGGVVKGFRPQIFACFTLFKAMAGSGASLERSALKEVL